MAEPPSEERRQIRLPRLRRLPDQIGPGPTPPVRPPSTPLVWLLATGVILSLGLVACLVWLTVLAPRPTGSAITPTLTLLTATPGAPQATPPTTSIPPSPVATTPPPATATTELPPTPPPGQVGVGSRVKVVGTGGQGLSLRQQPDPNAPRLAIAAEGELLQIIGGSRQIAGYTWWQVRRADGVEGWAVQNYMQVTTEP